VRHVFTLCGRHVLPIYDGCLTEGVVVVDVRHEQAAATRATRTHGSAWDRVAVVVSGPGVIDTVTGVANAYAARTRCC